MGALLSSKDGVISSCGDAAPARDTSYGLDSVFDLILGCIGLLKVPERSVDCGLVRLVSLDSIGLPAVAGTTYLLTASMFRPFPMVHIG